ncbi:hypothetical protein V6N13_035785 [Hibiscus sabdariffa]|uniref:Uncharacterized protein n=1 Tax=Hibiscus sabdariffa TaxID=183260 RepID=A0ABR2S937_9ROSI
MGQRSGKGVGYREKEWHRHVNSRVSPFLSQLELPLVSYENNVVAILLSGSGESLVQAIIFSGGLGKQLSTEFESVGNFPNGKCYIKNGAVLFEVAVLPDPVTISFMRSVILSLKFD